MTEHRISADGTTRAVGGAGGGALEEAFIEPATSGSLKPDYESGAMAPLTGSDQAEPPRQKARAESTAKKHWPKKH